MTNRSACRLSLLVFFALNIAIEVAAQPIPIYLGPPEDFSVATEVNEKGEVAGAWYVDGDPHAFFWTPELGMVDVGVLDGYTFSQVDDLNDNGQLVGRSFRSFSGAARAFSWTTAGGILDLGTLGGDFSAARAVNNRGQVVGWSEMATGETHAFLWTATEGMIDLGTLGGRSYAWAINESGQIVGERGQSAFSWTPATGFITFTLAVCGESLSY